MNGYNVTNRLLPDPQPPEEEVPRIARLRMTDEELAELIELFDYLTPLFGMLLATGLEIPAYPFIFGGIGGIALIALIVLSRKKKDKQS